VLGYKRWSCLVVVVAVLARAVVARVAAVTLRVVRLALHHRAAVDHKRGLRCVINISELDWLRRLVAIPLVMVDAIRRAGARLAHVLRRVNVIPHHFHFPLVILRVLLLFRPLLVNLVVSQALVTARKRLWAVLALVRLLTGVNSHMRSDVIRSREMPVAVRAREGLLLRVHARVSFQFVRAVERFSAVLPVARVLLLFRLLLRCLSDLWASRGGGGFRFDLRDGFEFEVLVDGRRSG